MNLKEFQQSESSASPHYFVLGNPVSHSLSPLMHNLSLEHYRMEGEYFAVSLQPDEFSELAVHLLSDYFRGANVTLPYKQTIIEYLDRLDTTAREVGAVNTIVKEDNRLVGYNTDIYGFTFPLAEFKDRLDGGRAIIFGTGGASRAVVAALKDLNMVEIILISRKPRSVKDFEIHDNVYVEGYGAWTSLSEEAELIVNATPLGMYPKVEGCPVRDQEKQFLANRICYDLVYNPRKTTFLSMAEEVGGTTVEGLEMLIHQGSRAFELWTGKPFPIDKVEQRLNEEIDS